MKTLHKNRLLKLAAFLEELPRVKFRIDEWVTSALKKSNLSGSETHACGTVCCAVGWMPRVFPKHWTWTMYEGQSAFPELKPPFKSQSPGEDAATYFNIYYNHMYYLFMPGSYINKKTGHTINVGPGTVAKRIRKFVVDNP